MPIDPDFPRKYRIIGRHSHTDGKQYHLVWGPGKENGESSTDTQVQDAYRKRGERYVPLGMHGTTVAVDWDSCIGDGVCIDVCPVSLYDWADSPGHPLSERKADPAREKDCIQCLACEMQCPAAAIKITPQP